jgi:abhydrolase domain-containing protein 6
MSVLTRIEAALGQQILRGVMSLQRRSLGVSHRIHRDRRGRSTAYLELGNPRRGTLVWLHGFGDRTDNFLPTARSLRAHWRILVPAMPGFPDGWIDRNEQHTFDAYVQWLSDVLRDIAGPKFHLMGNSLGGATALGIAAAMPERVASVVPVNNAGIELEGVISVVDEMRSGKNLFAVRTMEEYQALTARIFASPPRIPRAVRTHLYLEQRERADWYTRLIDDMAKSTRAESASAHVDLANIRVPTLVVWGNRDTLFPLRHGEHVANTIPGAELSVLDGVGHCPHLESPRRLANAFHSFAERVGLSSS